MSPSCQLRYALESLQGECLSCLRDRKAVLLFNLQEVLPKETGNLVLYKVSLFALATRMWNLGPKKRRVREQEGGGRPGTFARRWAPGVPEL